MPSYKCVSDWTCFACNKQKQLNKQPNTVNMVSTNTLNIMMMFLRWTYTWVGISQSMTECIRIYDICTCVFHPYFYIMYLPVWFEFIVWRNGIQFRICTKTTFNPQYSGELSVWCKPSSKMQSHVYKVEQHVGPAINSVLISIYLRKTIWGDSCPFLSITLMPNSPKTALWLPSTWV